MRRAQWPATPAGLRSARQAQRRRQPCTRSAVPRAITQAEPSFLSVPSGASEIRLVSGPPTLVSLVSSTLSGGGVFFSVGRGGASFAGDRGLRSGLDLGADSGLGLGLDCGRGLDCGLGLGWAWVQAWVWAWAWAWA